MALLFMDSFDHWSADDFGQKWDTGTIGSSQIGNFGRWGVGGGFRARSGDILTKGLNPTAVTGIFGMAVRPHDSSQIAFFQTYSSIIDDRPMLIASRNANGSVSVWRTDDAANFASNLALPFCTLLDSTPAGLVPVDTWSYIGFKLKHSDAAGTVDVEVNGNVELSLTLQDTLPGTRVFDGFSIGCSQTSGYIDFDDLYVADEDTADPISDLQGDVRVQAIYPIADVLTDWTPSIVGAHWRLVDEHSPNGDVDYISTLAAGNKDAWTYEQIFGTGRILGVQVNMSARKDTAGTKKIAAIARVGGVNYIGADKTLALDQYKYYREIYPVNPATLAEWTTAEVNAAQFGVVVTV